MTPWFTPSDPEGPVIRMHYYILIYMYYSGPTPATDPGTTPPGSSYPLPAGLASPARLP